MSVKLAYKTDWFVVEEDSSEDPKNPYYRIKAEDTVLILPITPEGEIILVEQYRLAIKSQTIEIPAGGIDEGEVPLVAAKRELFEETGCVAKKWKFIGSGRVMMNRFDSRLYGYLAMDVESLSNDSELKIKKMPWKKFKKVVLSGRFEQLVGLGLIQMADWKFGNLINAT